MDSFRQFLFSKTRTKISLATLICLFAFGFLYEAWRRDGVHAVVDYGSKYAEQIQSNQQQDEDAIEGVVFATTSTKEAEAEAEATISIITTITTITTTTTPATETTTSATETSPTQLPALIAGAVNTDDLTWMQDLSSTHDIHTYSVTNPDSVPANKGREAMVYLTYLISNYDSLPPHAIFIHGHEFAWHQETSIISMIQNLQISALHSASYVSFRCSWSPSCPAELRPLSHDAIVWGDGINVRETENAIGDAWGSLFPRHDLPHTIASQCCAQFAVTREAMLRWGKEDYERMRDWILKTDLEDAVSGRVFEKLWAWIFTGEAVHCPAPQAAACKFFNDCRPHHWPVPPKGLGPLPVEK